MGFLGREAPTSAGLLPIKRALTSRVAAHCLFLAAALVLSYTFAQLHFSLNKEYGRATLEALTNHTAERPFQFRALIPWMVALASRLPLPGLNSPLRLFHLIEWASVFCLVLAFRRYLSLFFGPGARSAWLALTLFYALPFNYLYLGHETAYYYPSDMPAILIFTLGLIWLYQERWVAFYALFVIGAFNRETVCFLTFIYLFNAIGKSRWREIVGHCALQFVLWAGVKWTLWLAYESNPGASIFEKHLQHNKDFFSEPGHWLYFCRTLGYVWAPVLAGFWLIPDRFVRRSLLVVFPFLIGMTYVGNLFELRIYGELIPVFLPAFLLVMRELIRILKQLAREPATPVNVLKAAAIILPLLFLAGWIVNEVVWSQL